MRRPALVAAAAAAIVTVAALAGCTASGGSTAGGGNAAGSAARAASAGADTASGAAEFQTGSGKIPAASDRKVVTDGSLSLVADHPIATANRIQAIVTEAGGSVADSTENPTGRASANLTVRIPSAAFPATLAKLEREGDVRNVDISATDVTSRVTDYAVRIQNLRTSISRLQQLLAKATSSSALVEIEGSLTDRQGTLEQLLAQQKALADQVALSTLRVSVVTPAAAPPQGPNDFLAGLATGWNGLVATLAALAVVAGVALPWIVLLGGLGAIAWFTVRTRRRAKTA